MCSLPVCDGTLVTSLRTETSSTNAPGSPARTPAHNYTHAHIHACTVLGTAPTVSVAYLSLYCPQIVEKQTLWEKYEFEVYAL